MGLVQALVRVALADAKLISRLEPTRHFIPSPFTRVFPKAFGPLVEKARSLRRGPAQFEHCQSPSEPRAQNPPSRASATELSLIDFSGLGWALSAAPETSPPLRWRRASTRLQVGHCRS